MIGKMFQTFFKMYFLATKKDQENNKKASQKRFFRKE
jgi:hypothetical protein